MKFVNKINSLGNAYNCEVCGRQDNAFLYGIYDVQPPLAEHIVYLPMPEEVMRNMISNYKCNFPVELLELYRTMNGADFFWRVRIVGKNRIRIASNCFSIYGVPLTYDRKHIEPFNISIEDLNRPEGTPSNWLKFGSYCRPTDLSDRLDLFVDTDNNMVYSVRHESAECIVVESWDTIDNCLCDVYDLLEEYNETEMHRNV